MHVYAFSIVTGLFACTRDSHVTRLVARLVDFEVGLSGTSNKTLGLEGTGRPESGTPL